MAHQRRQRERNSLLSQARQRLVSPSGSGRSMSRQELADAVNTYLWHTHAIQDRLNESDIGKLERGQYRWPGHLRREAFRAILGADTDAQLGFYITRGRDTATDHNANLRLVDGKEANSAATVDDMNRRTLLAAALGVGANASIFAADPFATSGVGEAQLPPVDDDLIEHFAQLRAMLVDADNRLGARSVLPTVRTQLAMIAGLRRSVRGRLRTDLLATEARWLEFSGWLNDDLGNHVAGDRYIDTALGIAREANDHEFSAYLLARQAQRAIRTQDEDRVVGLADAAICSGNVPVPVRAFALVQRAQGHAIDGDETAFQRSLDQARTIIATATDTDTTQLGSFCTEPYVLAYEGEGWLRLGKPSLAVRSLTDAARSWPGSYRRDRGLCLARTASAHLAADDPDQAATAGLQALALAQITGSVRIRTQIVGLATSIQHHHTRPAPAALLAQLAAT